MAVRTVSLGVNTPVPKGTQIPDVAPLVTDPFNATTALLAQTVGSTPAITFGISDMVSINESITVSQAPFPVLDKINIIVPSHVSMSLGL